MKGGPTMIRRVLTRTLQRLTAVTGCNNDKASASISCERVSLTEARVSQSSKDGCSRDYRPTLPLAQRAFAACWAIAFFCSAVSFSARALPPFLPPRRPRATAKGFLPSRLMPVVSSTIRAAIWFTSLLERLGIRLSSHTAFVKAIAIRSPRYARI
jgi:hypothetical protein